MNAFWNVKLDQINEEIIFSHFFKENWQCFFPCDISDHTASINSPLLCLQSFLIHNWSHRILFHDKNLKTKNWFFPPAAISEKDIYLAHFDMFSLAWYTKKVCQSILRINLDPVSLQAPIQVPKQPRLSMSTKFQLFYILFSLFHTMICLNLAINTLDPGLFRRNASIFAKNHPIRSSWRLKGL